MYNDQRFLGEVAVLAPVCLTAANSAAYLDGVKILVFESRGSERMLGPQEGELLSPRFYAA